MIEALVLLKLLERGALVKRSVRRINIGKIADIVLDMKSKWEYIGNHERKNGKKETVDLENTSRVGKSAQQSQNNPGAERPGV